MILILQPTMEYALVINGWELLVGELLSQNLKKSPDQIKSLIIFFYEEINSHYHQSLSNLNYMTIMKYISIKEKKSYYGTFYNRIH